jgi:hypothetical protein
VDQEHEDQAAGRARALNRRTILKAAVAGGTMSAVWVAPSVRTLSFNHAAAATPCDILSAEAQDQNSNSGNPYCPANPVNTCCGQSFGNSGQAEFYTFSNPVAGCTQITVRVISNDCTQPNNPDFGNQALIISGVSESVAGACGQCSIKEAVLVTSSGRQEVASYNNGSVCGGIDASMPCTATVSSSRMAVRITCVVDDGSCVPVDA